MKNSTDLANQFDIIIVGAGIGSLVAAAIQARRGKKVLVLERQSQYGGYATVFGRGGAVFDVSLHQIGGVYKTGLKRILTDAGIYQSIPFIKHRYLTELQLNEEQEVIKINNGDVNSYINFLQKRFPKEKRAINCWFKTMRSYGREIKIYDWLQPKSAIVRGVILFFFPLICPRLVYSRLFINKLKCALPTNNEQLKKIFYHFNGYYGLPASRLNILFPMIANYGYYYDGGYYIRGGGFTLVKLLLKVIRKNNGIVKCKQNIKQILVDKKSTVQGVIMEDDTLFKAKEVVCGANTISVLRNLLPNNNKAKLALQKLMNYELSMSASVLYIKIDVPIAKLNNNLANSYEYFLLPKLADDAYFALIKNRRDFASDYSTEGLVISIQSNIDETGKGKDNNATIFNVFFADNYERWADLSKEEYIEQKKIEQEKMLQQLAKLLPNVSEHIVTIELGTPLTMEKFTSNTKGAIYGFAQLPKQALQKRPEKITGIKGLYFVSAWSNPGGGYEGSIRSARNYTDPLFTVGSKLVFVLMLLLSIILPITITYWFKH